MNANHLPCHGARIAVRRNVSCQAEVHVEINKKGRKGRSDSERKWWECVPVWWIEWGRFPEWSALSDSRSASSLRLIPSRFTVPRARPSIQLFINLKLQNYSQHKVSGDKKFTQL